MKEERKLILKLGQMITDRVGVKWQRAVFP